MRKFLFSIVALLVAVPMFAQGPYDFSGRWFISAQGGAHYNMYENHFAFREHGKASNLITGQGAISVGYDLNKIWGFRLSVGFAKDSGSLNSREKGNGLYPYDFKDVNVFADAIVNLFGVADDLSAFAPKLYGGIGYAYSFGYNYTGETHFQQDFLTKASSFAFRLGVIFQYDFTNGIGLFADLGADAYTDNFNCLKPTTSDQAGKGYSGFPFDMKINASFGVVYHFN